MRISYPAKGRGVLYTHRVPPTRAYAVEIKKRLLAPLGIESRWSRPEVFLTSDEAQWGRTRRKELLRGEKKRLVTVDPSHRRPTRRWPAAHYGELCRDIETHLGALPVVMWGPGEGDLAREVAAASGGRAIVAPPTGLRELAALIAAADLHVGNCSAPRHIALAVGTPSFTVLGSTSRGWTYPAPEHSEVALGIGCQPCNRNRCDRNLECLRGFAPARVFDALSRWVDGALGWSRP